jgi:preprotein translocase subunit SecD
MRWFLVCLESLASGVLAIFASLVILVVVLHLYTRYVLGIGPNQTVGWDPISLFGPHWKLALMGFPLLILGIGFSIAFWFFSRLVRR